MGILTQNIRYYYTNFPSIHLSTSFLSIQHTHIGNEWANKIIIERTALMWGVSVRNYYTAFFMTFHSFENETLSLPGVRKHTHVDNKETENCKNQPLSSAVSTVVAVAVSEHPKVRTFRQVLSVCLRSFIHSVSHSIQIDTSV